MSEEKVKELVEEVDEEIESEEWNPIEDQCRFCYNSQVMKPSFQTGDQKGEGLYCKKWREYLVIELLNIYRVDIAKDCPYYDGIEEDEY